MLGLLVPVMLCFIGSQWAAQVANEIAQVFGKVVIAHLVEVIASLSLPTLMVLGEGGGYETETMVSATTSFAESLRYGEQALTIAREIGSRSAEVYALFILAHYRVRTVGTHGR